MDDRRTLADDADAAGRTESVTRVNAVLVKSLQQIHAMLNAEQRERFACLVRTGFLGL